MKKTTSKVRQSKIMFYKNGSLHDLCSMNLCNMYACLGQEGQDSGRTTFSNVLEAYSQARLGCAAVLTFEIDSTHCLIS